MNKHQTTVKTTWECWTYDVWGNAKDGYDVNDRFKKGTFTLDIPVTVYNIGTAQEFSGAYPTDKQIRECLGIRPRFHLYLNGDDLTIYVNLSKDDYPLGEMVCTSHKSLSLIREWQKDELEVINS